MKQFIVAVLVALVTAAPSLASDGVISSGPQADIRALKGDRRDTASTAEERRAARLDLMFGRLASATDERRAKRIARHIMRRLTQSGSDTVDFLMSRAAEAMEEKEYGKALDLLDGVVRLEPDFVEGWNRRATVHYLMGNHGQSLADIEQVLMREPRHWGALAGLSMILVGVERKAEAVEVMDKALAIHPHLDKMRDRRNDLIEELEGADT